MSHGQRLAIFPEICRLENLSATFAGDLQRESLTMTNEVRISLLSWLSVALAKLVGALPLNNCRVTVFDSNQVQNVRGMNDWFVLCEIFSHARERSSNLRYLLMRGISTSSKHSRWSFGRFPCIPYSRISWRYARQFFAILLQAALKASSSKSWRISSTESHVLKVSVLRYATESCLLCECSTILKSRALLGIWEELMEDALQEPSALCWDLTLEVKLSHSAKKVFRKALCVLCSR